MSKYFIQAGAVVAAALFAQFTFAQSGTNPETPATTGQGSMSDSGMGKSRAAVKAQTKSAEKSGNLAPAGESPLPQGDAARGNPDKAKSAQSIKSRAAVKSSTKSAEKAGDLAPAGQSPLPQGQATEGNPNVAKNSMSTHSRAHVKAQTKSAHMKGELEPAGEAVLPIGSPPKK